MWDQPHHPNKKPSITNTSKIASVVDTTVRLNWEVNKDEFDGCQYKDMLSSPKFTVNMGTQIIEWRLNMWPKGDTKEYEDKVVCFLNLLSEGSHNVKFEFSIKNSSGYWPQDHVEALYSGKSISPILYTFAHVNASSSYGESVCSTQDFSAKFINNKITLVTTVTIFKEGDQYYELLEMRDEFLKNVRCISNPEEFYDYTIVCGEKRIKCHRILLAARSTVFKAKFKHDTLDKDEDVLHIEDSSPETVEALLDYMTKGYKPKNLDGIANELIHKADYYGLELLVEACGASLMDNIAADNATETFVLIDQYLPRSNFREKIVDFIKEKADEVVKSNHWDEFYLNHPDLIKELFSSFCRKNNV